MTDQTSKLFGTEAPGKLLRQQAIPASVGILVMSIYGIIDTIFVGRWVGTLGIAAVTVVLPITFLIASVGMALGIGGSSIISRALGDKNYGKVYQTFGNQVMLTIIFALLFLILGFVYIEEILTLFGGRGEVLQPAKTYFGIILLGIPFLAWAMMSNSVIRAEGHPKIAMFTLVIPAMVNIVLDPVFILYLDMGLAGAAWATVFSYIASAGFTSWFFLKGKSQMKLTKRSFIPDIPIIKEITSLGSVTLARQGTVSVLSIVLNNSLFTLGGELGLSVYGIISRVLMFANFPVLGIAQGFVPIVGYNFGAKLMSRVSRLIKLSVLSATCISLFIFTLIMVFTPYIVAVFTNDLELIQQTTPALRRVFLATPLLAINMLGGAYFQAIGKAGPALIISMSKQGFLLIPLVFIMPLFFGLNGIWFAFPIADVGAAIIAGIYFFRKKSALQYA
ncbi:MAG: MATE family efflux transporter [Cyclobacteriaceae bacterium]